MKSPRILRFLAGLLFLLAAVPALPQGDPNPPLAASPTGRQFIRLSTAEAMRNFLGLSAMTNGAMATNVYQVQAGTNIVVLTNGYLYTIHGTATGTGGGTNTTTLTAHVPIFNGSGGSFLITSNPPAGLLPGGANVMIDTNIVLATTAPSNGLYTLRFVAQYWTTNLVVDGFFGDSGAQAFLYTRNSAFPTNSRTLLFSLFPSTDELSVSDFDGVTLLQTADGQNRSALGQVTVWLNAGDSLTISNSHVYSVSPVPGDNDPNVRVTIYYELGRYHNVTVGGGGGGIGETVTSYGYSRTVTNAFDVLNVRDFGARGNNVADDTSAIQAAINAAAATKFEVYFPPGTYRVTDTLTIPFAGGTGLTNRLAFVGNGWASTYINAQSISNKNLFVALAYWTNQAHVKFRGLWLQGPNYAYQVNGATRYYANLADLPFNNTAIAIGNAGAYSATNLLGAIETLIEECRIEGFRVGVGLSNVQSGLFERCWIQQNGEANVIMAHADSISVQGGHFGYVLVTNRTEQTYSFKVIGTPGSTWGGAAADSGVHRIFQNLEHHGPFLYADGARLTVFGGQFEEGNRQDIPHAKGWCHFTNRGQYNFFGSTINIAAPNTNTYLFALHNQASGGLRVMGCTINGEYDPLYANPRCMFFDISNLGTEQNLHLPYWDAANHGYDGSSSDATGTIFTDQISRINARLNGTNYFHVKQGRADALNLGSFKENGRNFIELSAFNGCDTSGNSITNNKNANGPNRERLAPIYNGWDWGFGLAWTPSVVTGSGTKYWTFEPFYPRTNANGTIPRNYKVRIPFVGTNAFTYYVLCDIQSADFANTAIYGQNAGNWTYTSTTTQRQEYVTSVFTLSAPPRGPLVLRWGINTSAPIGGVTNRFWMFNPIVEYW